MNYKGIEPPHWLNTVNKEVFGCKCSATYLNSEILVDMLKSKPTQMSSLVNFDSIICAVDYRK